jgi:hypothetical protein
MNAPLKNYFEFAVSQPGRDGDTGYANFSGFAWIMFPSSEAVASEDWGEATTRDLVIRRDTADLLVREVCFGKLLHWASRRPWREKENIYYFDEDGCGPHEYSSFHRMDEQRIDGILFNRRLIREALQLFVEAPALSPTVKCGAFKPGEISALAPIFYVTDGRRTVCVAALSDKLVGELPSSFADPLSLADIAVEKMR